MTVTRVKPTRVLLERLAEDMRAADRAEVWASGHYPPSEAVLGGWERSDYSSVAVDEDGVPLVVLGLGTRDLLSGIGVVWLLGTDEALKYRREFIKQANPLLNELLDICPLLYNLAPGKNKNSIRWLKRLGFTVKHPEPHCPDGELFHRFHIEGV